MECLLREKELKAKRSTAKPAEAPYRAMFFIILNKFNVFISRKNTCRVPIKPFFPQVINNSFGLRYLLYG